MKHILLSIQSQYVEKILNGKKLVEIRKSIPKCDLPCIVHIYCTKNKPYLYRVNDDNEFELVDKVRECADGYVKDYNCLNGKVVAEWLLKDYETLCKRNKDGSTTMTVVDRDKFEKYSCLTWEQYCEYHRPRNGKYSNSYAWHIDDLKIYDKPKELKEFCNNKALNYYDWLYSVYNGHKGARNNYTSYLNAFRLKQSSQDWCYVEEIWTKQMI